MMHSPVEADRSPQPRPLRIIATVSSFVTIVVGGLPTLGVPLSPEAAGWLVALVGAGSAVAVALFGERRVTPLTSPRDTNGIPLTPRDDG
jgi:hypothetical protein